MRRLFISAGHSVTGPDKGVPPTLFSKGFSEGELTDQFVRYLKNELEKMQVPVYTDKNSNALSDTLLHIKNIFKPQPKDILIDVHFNAFNKVANGTEVIVPKNPSVKESQIAQNICKLLSEYGFKNRGVKDETRTARKSLGWMRPQGENILIEVCFMDNQKDMDIYWSKLPEIIYTLAILLKKEYENAVV
jgi:N-acetylmuramoyl-L-alanine amidase